MSESMNSALEATLITAAKAVRLNAHAPYSRFLVGAAIATQDGRIFAGCNVENASYGLCNCAERTALFSAIAAGVRPDQFTLMAVTGDTPGPISPCGACRQVMVELCGTSMPVVLTNIAGAIERTTTGTLLPGAFRLDPN